MKNFERIYESFFGLKPTKERVQEFHAAQEKLRVALLFALKHYQIEIHYDARRN